MTTEEEFDKSTNAKADVEAEGQGRVDAGIAESYEVKDGGTVWMLMTTIKQIS